MRDHVARRVVPMLICFGWAVPVSAQGERTIEAFRGVRIDAADRATIVKAEAARLEAVKEGAIVQRRDPTVRPSLPHPIDIGVSTFVIDDFEAPVQWKPVAWAGQPEIHTSSETVGATGCALKLKCFRQGSQKSGVSLALAIDVSPFDRLLFDCHVGVVTKCNIAFAFWTGTKNEYFETPMMPMAQGWNRDHVVHLRAGTFKSATSGWQHTVSLANAQALRMIFVLVYHSADLELLLDNVRLTRDVAPVPPDVDGQPILSVLPASYRRAWDSLAAGEKAFSAKQYDVAAAAFEAAQGQSCAIYEQDALWPNAELMAKLASDRLGRMDEEMKAKGLVRFEAKYVAQDGASFEAALAAKPDDFSVRSQFVRFLRARGRGEEATQQAAAALMTAMEIRGGAKQIAEVHEHLEQLHTHHLVGSSTADRRILAGVEEALRDAIAAKPGLEANYSMLGRLYEKAGRTDDAADMYLAQPYRRPPAEASTKPVVGVYFHDKAPRGRRVRYGEGLKVVPILERGGYEPALFVLPRLADHATLRRYMQMVDSQVEFLNAGRLEHWARCAAVVCRWPWQIDDETALALVSYVEEGGGLVMVGSFGREETDPGIREALLGMDANEFVHGSAGKDLEVARAHPIVKGLEVGQVLPGPRYAYALEAELPEEEVILRYKDRKHFALAAREVGKGRVAHFCWYGPVSTMAGQAGHLTDVDLFLRAVDWVARRERARDLPVLAARPAAKRLPERLAASDGANVLFEDQFDRLDDTVWKIIDTEPDSYEKQGFKGPSKWSVHPVLRQLTQFSNIGAWGSRGSYGTNIVAGSEEWTDYTISVWVTPIDDDNFAVIFRYRDEQNYYRILSAADYDKYWALERIANGVCYRLKRVTSKCYIPGRTYLVEAAVHHDKIHAYVDGKLLMQAQDSTHRAGRIGLGCMSQTGIAFDDLMVYANESGWANVAAAKK